MTLEILPIEIFRLQIEFAQTHVDRISIVRDADGVFLVPLGQNETTPNVLLTFPVFDDIDFLWSGYAHWEDGKLRIPEENKVVDCLDSFIQECIEMGDWEEALHDYLIQLDSVGL